MKNSIILCEGSTDYVLLQYYMRKVNSWNDSLNQKGVIKFTKQKSRLLSKGENELTIAAMGGCSKLDVSLKQVFERNFNSSPLQQEVYHNIVIILDHDDSCVGSNVVKSVLNIFDEYDVKYSQVDCNKWNDFTMHNRIGVSISFKLLIMLIPFTQEGAMETFLLEAISDKDDYDAKIIKSANNFVENIDEERHYLNSRRNIVKAKFDVYFSIRTSAEQFNERQNILKNIPWEDYPKIQEDFYLLSEI
ncbi:MAG: DUF3226 domain-containing protein [Selenomonadaceae bacterium]|nr:DUF3226 domain-containing protein [Selenomonadaceae bacterium]